VDVYAPLSTGTVVSLALGGVMLFIFLVLAYVVFFFCVRRYRSAVKEAALLERKAMRDFRARRYRVSRVTHTHTLVQTTGVSPVRRHWRAQQRGVSIPEGGRGDTGRGLRDAVGFTPGAFSRKSFRVNP